MLLQSGWQRAKRLRCSCVMTSTRQQAACPAQLTEHGGRQEQYNLLHLSDLYIVRA